MIILLLGGYCAILYVLIVKLKLVKPTLPVKVIAVLVGIGLLCFIFVGLQVFSPVSLNAVVLQKVIPMAPRQGGRVIEVKAQPMVPLKKGDVILRINPQSAGFKITELEASLSAAQQLVPQLKAAWEQAKSQTQAAIIVRDNNKVIMDRYVKLGAANAASQADVDNATAKYNSSVAETAQAEAMEQKAQLAYKSEIGGTNTSVAQIQAQLDDARYDLSQTIVLAPDDGYIVNFQVREGTTLSQLAGAPMFVFVPNDGRTLTAVFKQNAIGYIKPGDKADIVMECRPGVVFPGTVGGIIEITGETQMALSGQLPSAIDIRSSGYFAVKINLDEPGLLEKLPAGGSGMVAIYTDQLASLHIIRRVMMHMKSYTNFIYWK